ncbi:MAG TPA: UDP-N-acetylmuramoyl-L-alanine--D-glutamate ligase [Rhizomicrobium sp.]|jgi:UDP-N-acetylmuramoylalanine--D-glutamate ligase|nr:UDP-N-acetylmuramoyl-L-alanine--D-glutamate ligase [Rhizomicrobium sp.]
MIVPRNLGNQDVGVFGLARTGVSAARALIAGGARVYAWDDGEASRRGAEELGARVLSMEAWPWERLSALILSPGVPLTHPAPHTVVDAARNAGVVVIGDMELFAREIRSTAPLVAVTGTNGKSTSTALIGHILSACGYVAEIGGNIGKPVLDLDPPEPRTAYVLEVSSYQIELSPSLSPDVAVLTNISPDHLDRHGSMENYAAVKARLLQQTSKSGVVCVGVDDAYSAAIQSRFAAEDGPEAVPISVGKVLGRGVFVIDGILYDAQASNAARIMDLRTAARLPGAHNWQNAALAYAATRRLVQNRQAIADAIATFPALPHRIEDVGRVGKVRFINDSKATNAEAAGRALQCFSDVFWIAGGRSKESGIKSLQPLFSRLRKAYLIGEAAEEFARTLKDVPHELCGTLAKAVAAAAADAQLSNAAAPVVLLSPACASFDQFHDYEQRGDVFRALVRQLSTHPMREAS